MQTDNIMLKVTSVSSTIERVEREEQIMKKWKGLRTCFTCMCPGVGLKMVWPWELSLTGFALEWLNAYTHTGTYKCGHTHTHKERTGTGYSRETMPKCVREKKNSLELSMW